MVEVEACRHEEQTALEMPSRLAEAPHQSSPPRQTARSLICLLHLPARLITGQDVFDSLVNTFSHL